MKSNQIYTFLILSSLITFSAQAASQRELPTPPRGNPLVRMLTRYGNPLSYLDSRHLPNVAIKALKTAQRNLSDKQNFASLEPHFDRTTRFADTALGYFWSNFTPNLSDHEKRILGYSQGFLNPLLQKLSERSVLAGLSSGIVAVSASPQYQQTTLYEILVAEQFDAGSWQDECVPNKRGLEVLVNKIYDSWDHVANPKNSAFYNWIYRAIHERSLAQTTEVEQITQYGTRLAQRASYTHEAIIENLKKHVYGTKSGWFYTETRPKSLRDIYKAFMINKPNISRPIALIFEKIIVDLALKDLAHSEQQVRTKELLSMYRDKKAEYQSEQTRIIEEIKAMIAELSTTTQTLNTTSEKENIVLVSRRKSSPINEKDNGQQFQSSTPPKKPQRPKSPPKAQLP